MLSPEKAKLILAAIIHAAGGSFNGKTRLYKAFYVAHLLHFRDQQGVLSDHPIVRMPRGPAVQKGEVLLSELRQAGIIAINKRPVGPYQEDVFTLVKPLEGLTLDEIESIRKAVAMIGDMSAAELSEWTHEFSNTWEETPDGHEMNIYADLLSELECAEMKKRHDEAGKVVDAVFAR
jgi:uncharacterized phage-associated protein